jgi:glycosyltransferase involved in cell wall biosynthesis
MRIGLEVTAAVTQGGGIGRYTRELLRALMRVDEANSYRLFYAAAAPHHSLPPLNARTLVRRLPFHDIWLARLWHRLRLPVPVETVLGSLDVYHSPDFTLPPTRARSLLTVHDLSFVRDPDSASPGLRDYLNAVVPRSVARSDHVLVDSTATKQDLVDLYRTPVDKITVLYCGVEPAFKPVVEPAVLDYVRNKYKIGRNPFILAVSTLQPRKNYVRLLQAFARLTDPDLRLVFAGGKGWLFTEIFATVRDLQLSERVVFAGFVADDDLPALYSAARALAYPSLYEGFGLPMLEAMACGTPVVASTASSLPEVAGDAALLVDPFDVDALAHALDLAHSDTRIRARLIRLGRFRATRFRWDDSARQLLQLYMRL